MPPYAGADALEAGMLNNIRSKLTATFV